MSHHDYEVARRISAQDPPFAALIMAAARKADTGNMAKLIALFPQIVAEQQQRYDAPAGILPTDPDWDGDFGSFVHP